MDGDQGKSLLHASEFRDLQLIAIEFQTDSMWMNDSPFPAD
jgi:hypothetical protein